MKQLLIPGVGGALPGELIVDLFAGGGGASTGLEAALGRPPDLAVNHDPAAIQMHAANHPATDHRCESIYAVSPREATHGAPVGVLWASPSCTHFSRARGGTPVSKQERGLGWMIVKWAALTKARIIFAENVPEWETWGPVRRGRPVKAKAGRYFQQLVAQLRALGYAVEWRTLVAADYGAPTTRRRLYLIARRDGAPIAWPSPTHGPKASRPYRTAAECIDWSDLGTSIFDRKKPLAEATCRRIAAGVVRFVLRGKPFLVNTAYGGTTGRGSYVYGPDEPLRTVTSSNGFAVVSAFLSKYFTSKDGRQDHAIGMDAPLGTVTAVDHHALVACHLTTLRGTQGSHLHGDAADSPLRTISAGGQHHALVAAFLTQYHATGGQHSKASDPLPTITTVAGHALVTMQIDGQDYVITDIRMRMLHPRELATAQGFPASYVMTGTKADQIGRIGNSVCPAVAEALARANAVQAKRGAA